MKERAPVPHYKKLVLSNRFLPIDLRTYLFNSN